MSGFNLSELIDNEVLRSKGQYFRNKDIVLATGASRSHVSQRLKFLWDEGVLEKHGQDWTVIDQAKLVTMLMRQARALSLTSSKLLSVPASKMETGLEVIQLLQSTRSEWEAYSLRLERALLEEVDTALETLRNFKKLLQNPTKSQKQIYMHMLNSPGYANDLQSSFVALAKNFLGEDLDNKEVITEDIRPSALERYGNA